MDRDVRQIVDWLAKRNEIDQKIAQTIGRPVTSGHLGEWIAARIFDIDLEQSATTPGIDGHFLSGRLAGKSVNVKWYLQDTGLLDIARSSPPDFYLVLAGPKAAAVTSKGSHHPWTIKSVYLIATAVLMRELEDAAVKIGVATSVRLPVWERSKIYPDGTNSALQLSDEQRTLLRFLGP